MNAMPGIPIRYLRLPVARKSTPDACTSIGTAPSRLVRVHEEDRAVRVGPARNV